MDLGLGGQIAVVVGGASGIGWAIAVEFAQEGCSVILIDREPQVASRALELPIAKSSVKPHRGLVADVCDVT